jgi:hypothetical protein
MAKPGYLSKIICLRIEAVAPRRGLETSAGKSDNGIQHSLPQSRHPSSNDGPPTGPW